MKPKQLRSSKLKSASVIRLCSLLGAAYLEIACAGSAEEQPRNNEMREGLVITEIVGEQWGHLGGAVSFLGDLDADGYDDFALLAAHGGMGDHGGTGSLYLFYGRETFPERLDVTDADLVLRGAHESVAALGDVDRDGYPDFAFTANCDDPEEECLVTEGVRLVYGASERYAGEMASEEVGSIWSSGVPDTHYNRVSPAGDVNADGHADLLFDVSIPESDQKDPRRSGFLLLGREDRAEQMPTGIDFDARFDAVGDGELQQIVGLSSPGDIDADGHSDLILRTLQEADSDIPRQALWLYYGSEELEHTRFDPLVADASFVWSEKSSSVGSGDVGSDRLGDLGGDGYDDLAFAIAGDDSEVVHVVDGRGDRFAGLQDIGAVSWSFTTPSGRANQLRSGDIDADGRLDLVIGDWEDSAISYHAGALLSFLAPGDGSSGSRDLSREDVLLYGTRRSSESNDRLGKQVAGGGDANADGYDDILVTAPGDFVFDVEGGRAFLVFGSELD